MPNNCSDILKNGIYNYEKSVEERTYSFINWYRNHEIKTYQQAKSMSLGIEIDDILDSLNFSKNESGFQQFMRLIESYTVTNETFKLDKALQTISSEIIDAWTKCINRFGAHLWVEHTEDPYEFIVCGKYVDDGAKNQPKVKYFDVEKDRINNNDGPFINADGSVNAQTILGGGIDKQRFKRKDKKPFTFILGLTQGDSLEYSFKEISELPLKTVTEKLPVISGDPITQTYGPYDKDVFLDFTIYQTCTKTDSSAQMRIIAEDAITKDIISSDETSDIKSELDFGHSFTLKLSKGQTRKITFRGWVNGCTKKIFRVLASKTELE